MVNLGQTLECIDEEYKSALYAAAKKGQVEKVKFLASLGAKVIERKNKRREREREREYESMRV